MPDRLPPLGPPKRPEPAKPGPDDWRPHPTNPQLEVNGRGQLRTRDFAWPFQPPVRPKGA